MANIKASKFAVSSALLTDARWVTGFVAGTEFGGETFRPNRFRELVAIGALTPEVSGTYRSVGVAVLPEVGDVFYFDACGHFDDLTDGDFRDYVEHLVLVRDWLRGKGDLMEDTARLWDIARWEVKRRGMTYDFPGIDPEAFNRTK